MMMRMTLQMTMWMSVTDCVYEMTTMMMMMIMIMMCYRSVVLFVPFGVIVLALMISFCSRARRKLSCRLRMVSNQTTVTSVIEWLGLLKCFASQDFSC